MDDMCHCHCIVIVALCRVFHSRAIIFLFNESFHPYKIRMRFTTQQKRHKHTADLLLHPQSVQPCVVSVSLPHRIEECKFIHRFNYLSRDATICALSVDRQHFPIFTPRLLHVALALRREIQVEMGKLRCVCTSSPPEEIIINVSQSIRRPLLLSGVKGYPVPVVVVAGRGRRNCIPIHFPWSERRTRCSLSERSLGN